MIPRLYLGSKRNPDTLHVLILMIDVYEVDVHVRGNEIDDVDAADVADDDRIELEVEHELHFPHQASNLKLCFESR